MANYKKILFYTTAISSLIAYRHEKEAARIFEDYFLAISDDDEYLLKKYQDEELLEHLKEEEKLIEWYKLPEKESIEIQALDGLMLSGSLIKNKGQKYIILIHDHFANKMSMLKYAAYYYENDYDVLLIDQRSSGNSQGDYYSYGLKEQFDLLLWIDYLKKDCSDKRIIIHGVGAGANTAVLALQHCENVEVIAQTPVTDLVDQLKNSIIKTNPKLAVPSILMSINRRFKKATGFHVEDIKLDLNRNDIYVCKNEDDIFENIDYLIKKGLI